MNVYIAIAVPIVFIINPYTIFVISGISMMARLLFIFIITGRSRRSSTATNID